ncbi:MAG TPA: hypothetical protein VFR67_05945 [Pilimelia sp.]|nr:hypothetical protein [Pilimelia sp.]
MIRTNLEISLCEEDRKRLGGPEWLTLDVDRVYDTPASMLERWEMETGYAIERAMLEVGQTGAPPARATRVVVWLARKQAGVDGGGTDEEGRPESFSRLADLRTMQVAIRYAARPEAGDAGDPPADPGPESSAS